MPEQVGASPEAGDGRGEVAGHRLVGMVRAPRTVAVVAHVDGDDLPGLGEPAGDRAPVAARAVEAVGDDQRRPVGRGAVDGRGELHGQTIRLVMTASSVMSSQWKPATVIRASRPVEVRARPALDAEQHRAEVARRLLQILEAGDVVLRAEQGEEVAQRPRALRQPQDVVFLPALPAQRPLLDVGQPLEVEVAAGDDGDHAPAVERAEVAERVDRQRPGRLEDHPLDVQHLDHRRADAVLRREQHLRRRDIPEHREVQVADARDRGAVDEAVDLGQGDGAARLQRPAQARRAGRLDEADGRAGASAAATCTRPAARPPPPTGAMTRSGAGSASNSSSASVACPSMTSASSNGGRNSASASSAKARAEASVASK